MTWGWLSITGKGSGSGAGGQERSRFFPRGSMSSRSRTGADASVRGGVSCGDGMRLS